MPKSNKSYGIGEILNSKTNIDMLKGYDCAATRKAKRKRVDMHAHIVDVDVDDNTNRVQQLIAEECDALKELLLTKNKAYGNSALDPLRIFARGLDAEAQILVRIDDKLSRIKRGDKKATLEIVENTERDLGGYLILLAVLRRLQSEVTNR